MRLTRSALVALAIAGVCCVSMPTPAARKSACQSMQDVHRWQEPCEFARLLAACSGLPESYQAGVVATCEQEIQRLDSELSTAPPVVGEEAGTEEAQSTISESSATGGTYSSSSSLRSGGSSQSNPS